MGGSWQPVLSGHLRDRALEAVEAVATSLVAPDCPATDASLAGGDAGIAVFLAYLNRVFPGRGYGPAACHRLDRSIERIGAEPMPPSLHSGFSGVAWAVEHLRDGSEPDGEDDSNEEVDTALAEFLDRAPWRDDYDLISGLVGLGVYALERLPRPTARLCLDRVLDRLREASEHRGEGLTWHTSPSRLPDWQRQECPAGHYNLGAAHGVAGVIGFLGQVMARGVGDERVGTMLESAVDWLLAQAAGTRFPHWLVPGAGPGRSRYAWCYGSPGVASTLWVAARAVRRPSWGSRSLEIARAVLAASAEEADVGDAGVCHGACGLGHIANRFHQSTGEAAFAQLARDWFDRALGMRTPGRGIGGFVMPYTVPMGEPGNNAGLLDGSAGVALTLLAAATDQEPAWDRILLLS